MTPMTNTTCVECKRPLNVEVQHEPLEANCKHRIKREFKGDGDCRLCVSERAKLFGKWLLTGRVCTDCKAREDADEEKREAKKDLERCIIHSQMPMPLHGFEWGSLDRSGTRGKAIAAAITWASADPTEAKGIYLWGDTGTGKTRVAATAAWHRMNCKGTMLRWVSVAVLLANLEGSYSDKDRLDALRVLTGDGPIVLDDIDKVKATEQKLTQLFAAIDRRVTAGVPMFVTGNLSPALLEQKLDGPIASRILGYAYGRTFKMDGPDRRTTLDVDA